jgi:hypothetical protein
MTTWTTRFARSLLAAQMPIGMPISEAIATEMPIR